MCPPALTSAANPAPAAWLPCPSLPRAARRPLRCERGVDPGCRQPGGAGRVVWAHAHQARLGRRAPSVLAARQAPACPTPGRTLSLAPGVVPGAAIFVGTQGCPARARIIATSPHLTTTPHTTPYTHRTALCVLLAQVPLPARVLPGSSHHGGQAAAAAAGVAARRRRHRGAGGAGGRPAAAAAQPAPAGGAG